MNVKESTPSLERREIERNRRVHRAIVALLVALGTIDLIWHHIGNTLAIKTDVVGYPIFANFNINRYFDAYYLTAFAGPLVFLLVYQLLSQFGPIKRQAPRRHATRVGHTLIGDEHLPDLTPKDSNVSQIARLFSVGALLGLELHTTVVFDSIQTPIAIAMWSAIYGLTVAMVAKIYALTGKGRTWISCASLVNCFGAIAMIPLLYQVSQSTTITITSTGQVVHYPWIPFWMVLVLSGSVIFYVVYCKVRKVKKFIAFDRKLILFLSLPIAIFLVHANIPGAFGSFDPFAEGEQLASSWLLLHGVMPWRDVYLIHGVLDDGFKNMIGFQVFGHTRWGANAGSSMIVSPIYWVCLYYFGALLFFRRTFFVLGIAACVTLGIFVDQEPRYTFWPLVLVLLARAIERRTIARTIALVIALIVQAILIPEMAFAIVACAISVVGYEIYERDSLRISMKNYPITLWSIGSSVVLGTGFTIWLIFEHALHGFIGYYKDFADAHSIVGGIPLYTNYAVFTPTDTFGITLHAVASPAFFTRYRLELIIPILAIVATIWMVTARVRGGKRLVVQDWLCIAAAVMVALYYQKGISRGDTGHIAEVFCVTAPLLVLLVYRLIVAIELSFNRSKSSRSFNRVVKLVLGRLKIDKIATPITLASLILVLAVAPMTINGAVANFPHQIQSAVPYPATAPLVPGGPGLGYSQDAIPTDAVLDIEHVFNRYAGKDGSVFDFSNSPGIVSFLLNRKLTTQFYNINDVLSPSSQAELIAQLRTIKPKIVLFNGMGMGAWDFIPNEIRDSTVSDYLLTNYRPLVDVAGQLFLIRNSVVNPKPLPKLVGTVQTRELYLALGVCEWGYIPNFLSTPTTPAEKTRSLTVPLRFVKHTTAGSFYKLVGNRHVTDYHWISVTIKGATSKVALTISSNPESTTRDISWVAKGSGTTQVETASCLQWHGFINRLYLRYLGPGTPTSIKLIK